MALTSRIGVVDRGHLARPAELYSLNCWRCGRDIELDTAAIVEGCALCPRCGVELEIQWRIGERTELSHG
jgi:hypothetical protein